jgi:hypothetical protein
VAKECFGCRKPRAAHPLGFANTEITLSIRIGAEAEGVSMSYCPDCARKIMRVDRDLLRDGVERHIAHLIGSGPKLKVSISEELVREIASNLGASDKLKDALVERVFGKDWNGVIPPGARMNEYQNRDRLVAFVVSKLKDLWTLEA